MDWVSFVLTLIAGLLLVFAGRRFFWLAAGMIAFMFSFSLFQKSFGPGWAGIALAMLLGAICAWLSILFVRTVGYLVGGLAGAAGLPILISTLGFRWDWWLLAIIGLLVGLMLVRFAYNWGLILMTGWVGASAMASKVSGWMGLNSRVTMWIFITLLGAGVIVQAAQLRRKR